MTARLRLPNRRRAETLTLEHAGLKYKVTIGYFDDGTPAEAFVSNHKAGNASDVAARDAGILLVSPSAIRLPGRNDCSRGQPEFRRLRIRRDRGGARHDRGGAAVTERAAPSVPGPHSIPQSGEHSFAVSPRCVRSMWVHRHKLLEPSGVPKRTRLPATWRSSSSNSDQA